MKVYVVDRSISSLSSLVSLLTSVDSVEFEYLIFNTGEDLNGIRKYFLQNFSNRDRGPIILVSYLSLSDPEYRQMHEVAAKLFDAGLRVGRIMNLNYCSDYVPFELRRKWDTIISIEKQSDPSDDVTKSRMWDLVSAIVDRRRVPYF